jgi:asparagine synthase (glutamine-hydrolysing)
LLIWTVVRSLREIAAGSADSLGIFISAFTAVCQHALLVSADDLMQYLPKMIEHGDAPVTEVSNIPIYLLSREAAKSVKMVLTGEGSDELLGGYPKHSAKRFTALYRGLVPACLHSAVVEPLVSLVTYKYRPLKIMMTSIGLRDPRKRLPR